MSGKRVVFKGERRVILNSIISVMTTRKLIRKGCHAWLSHVRELKTGSIELTNIPIVKEFLDVFWEELPGYLQLGRLRFPLRLFRGSTL
jgi:hypothetical protein